MLSSSKQFRTLQWFPDANTLGVHVALGWQEFNPGGQGSFGTRDFNTCLGVFDTGLIFLGPTAVGGGLV